MPSELLHALITAARAGARELALALSHPASLDVREKRPADFVSEADLRSEAAIKEALAAFDCGARFEAEESDRDRVTTGPRFIVDPLDGTTNFLHGIPHFAISIAYADDSGVVAGVVLDPSRDELFSADRGAGAFLGDRRLHATACPSLADAVVHTGIPHRGRGDHPAYLRQLARVMAEVSGIRRMGAAALDFAYVAAGRGDGFFETGLSPWDVAAGILLVREAGGVVTDLRGGDAMLDRREFVAAGPHVHAPLLAALQRA